MTKAVEVSTDHLRENEKILYNHYRKLADHYEKRDSAECEKFKKLAEDVLKGRKNETL